jgi:hypothetical protein
MGTTARVYGQCDAHAGIVGSVDRLQLPPAALPERVFQVLVYAVIVCDGRLSGGVKRQRGKATNARGEVDGLGVPSPGVPERVV